MKNDINKYKELRVRLRENDLDTIDQFCKIMNQSRAKLVKKAVRTYTYLNVENKERPNKKMIISQNILKPLWDSADEVLIEQMAEISFQNGMADTRYFSEILGKLRNPDKKIDMEKRVKSLVEGVFSADAQNWFEDVNFGWNGDILIMGGKHNLGPNFSLFIKHLLIKYMALYDYKLQKEEFRETQSKKNENMRYTIILYFNP